MSVLAKLGSMAFSRAMMGGGREMEARALHLDDDSRRECDVRLFEFCMSAFSVDEFLQFIRILPLGDRVVAQIPDRQAPITLVLDKGLQGLRQHGLIDDEFFRQLAERRPGRSEDIAALAQTCGCEKPFGGVWVADVEVAEYLARLGSSVEHVEVESCSHGEVRATNRALRELYVPLHCQHPLRMLLGELLREPRLLVVGPPGAGKTMFLKFIVGEQIQPRSGLRTRKGDRRPLAATRIPVLVRLSELAARLPETATPGFPDDHRWLLELLCSDESAVPVVGAGHHPDREARLTRWYPRLGSGDFVLLLDGFDEVEEPRRARVVAILADILRVLRNCPIVITSRPAQAAALKPLGCVSVAIDPLSIPEIEALERRWLQTSSFGGEERPAPPLVTLLREQPEFWRLAASPGGLMRMAAVHRSGQALPGGLARLYGVVMRWLLASRETQRRRAEFHRFAEPALVRLAFAMTSRAGSPRTFSVAEAVRAIDGVLSEKIDRQTRAARRAYVARWLGFECGASHLLEEREPGRFQFRDPTMQAYLTAVGLARREREHANGWWRVVKGKLDESAWSEALELLPACLHEHSEEYVNRLFEQLLKLGDGVSLPGQARILGHVERLIAPMVAYEYGLPRGLKAIFEGLQARVSQFLETGTPLTLRIAARAAYKCARRPRQTDDLLELPGLGVRLAKFPVTVAEYSRFVESGGYGDDSLWTHEGIRIRNIEKRTAPELWDEQVREDLPVVGVTWEEACAYCNWDARRTGLKVRLPTRREWESAASPDGRKYPWGDEPPTAERANYGGRIGAPTPVGTYPAGAGLFGHMDLAGNVSEWCGDAGETPDRELSWGRRHILKGGSWWEESVGTLAAQDVCYGYSKTRYAYRGFRIAVEDESGE